MAKGNKPGRRRFGNVRKLPSGRFQASYIGPDGQRRTAPETFERKSDAERWLTLTEAQIFNGDWTDPQRAKVKLGDYAAKWIEQRPGLRPRTVELYQWLLRKHIAPYLGGVELGKLSTSMIRGWRADLLAAGVSATMAAKAYRLLRAVLMTAVDEDKILTRNPCRVRGAGTEHAPERPVLTVAQVFELAERVGVRPVGNFRKLDSGEYRLRYRVKGGTMRRFPHTFVTRAEAERALWKLAEDGHADTVRDDRLRAFILLAAFASLRWGEITALRRCDIDTENRTVRVRAAFVERDNGQMILGPPKSRAGLRTVSIPAAIIPDLVAHLDKYTGKGGDALVFTGVKGGPMRRSGFNKVTRWTHVVRAMGVPGLHFHDLRHTGNTLAADMGVSLANLMARMGHDNERAALRYQHRSKSADRAIADGLDALVQVQQAKGGDDEDGAAGKLVPVA
ncbi:Phage integrase, N-terminal SAM-like domain [Thermomonospora echinospora]|uniref:Phage integrase, N-terminal SAM-like domain n=1 Tax=Thermomonospora echinospora TaxID=1992 RepID=A0A1H6DWA6_9ACTN|nr:site-specific integrase [Thermomonospora echinospora]SEG89617.1 Phage integrase, N-terminal SAM-like domain [Thermomonospora echinospora]